MKPFVEGRHESLAGIYAFFEMVTQNAVTEAARGVLAMPIKAHWGPINEFIELRSYPDAKQYFGTGLTAGLLQLAFWGSPLAVKVYRIATQEAKVAQLDLTSIVIKALYPGDRGNDFKITIRPYLDDPTKTELLVVEGATILQSIPFATIDELVEKASDGYYIRVEKVSDVIPEAISSRALSGGNSGATVTAEDYSAFFKAAEAESFNRIALDGVKDAGIKQMLIQFVKDQRALGKLIRGTVGGMTATAIDYYPIENVYQKAFKDGIEYSPEDVAIYASASLGSCPLNRSRALQITPFDEIQKLSNVDMQRLVDEGNLLFTQEGRTVRFSTPVNTMTTIKNFDEWYKMGDGADEVAVIKTLQKSKIVEANDYIAEVQDTFFKRFASYANTIARRRAAAQLFKDEVLIVMENDEVIEAGTSECIPRAEYHGENPTKNAYKDEAFFDSNYQIVDAMEKIYLRNRVA
ncbi:phage tail sheath N-terminal beta-sandwich domain-containing protein [Bacillus sp. CGMCC 1.16541]|uniref:phage tail sheath N-terminal beta-sandwich domain-containing protein n=1 Tax=Bacillus sp. CGMCC 1.16541 TaxID=2185143 RepID=UPI000D7313FF|nr:phage tail sheath N-terminal beta-sandwich domain-containing protein [Bacillus sp. CGMCC 1.16541]